ncbi:MAG: DUF2255 domain-containing protein [Thaumarchaeota archaeon]|nr:DUF2255 domain-containing protein [Nitrososphaerota archaeon]
MPEPDWQLPEVLAKETEVEVKLTVPGTGKERTLPVWFIIEGRRPVLLPMYGTKTKWFQTFLKTMKMELAARGRTEVVAPKVIDDVTYVEGVRSRFAAKYGEGDVRRYYPASEVALEIDL